MICPVCKGGGGSGDDVHCRKCKDMGEVEIACECGDVAQIMVDDKAMCAECLKQFEERGEE